MALTKVTKEVSSTPGIVDNSDSTAITIHSTEKVSIGDGTAERHLHVSGGGVEMSLSNTDMSTDRKSMNWFLANDIAYWRMINDAHTSGGGALALDFSGNLGIDVTPSYKCHVNGDIYATGNITAYSAAAAKSDIETIPNPLDLVEKLRGVNFTWKDSGEKAQGLIYEEVKEVVPEVTSDREGHVGIQYQNLVGLLIEAVKELKAEIKELKSNTGWGSTTVDME